MCLRIIHNYSRIENQIQTAEMTFLRTDTGCTTAERITNQDSRGSWLYTALMRGSEERLPKQMIKYRQEDDEADEEMGGNMKLEQAHT